MGNPFGKHQVHRTDTQREHIGYESQTQIEFAQNEDVEQIVAAAFCRPPPCR